MNVYLAEYNGEGSMISVTLIDVETYDEADDIADGLSGRIDVVTEKDRRWGTCKFLADNEESAEYRSQCKVIESGPT